MNDLKRASIIELTRAVRIKLEMECEHLRTVKQFLREEEPSARVMQMQYRAMAADTEVGNSIVNLVLLESMLEAGHE